MNDIGKIKEQINEILKEESITEKQPTKIIEKIGKLMTNYFIDECITTVLREGRNND